MSMQERSYDESYQCKTKAYMRDAIAREKIAWELGMQDASKIERWQCKTKVYMRNVNVRVEDPNRRDKSKW